MKRSSSLRHLGIRVIGACAAAALIVAPGGPAPAATETLKIGVVLPLGGAFGDFIKHQIYNPLVLATDERNAKGGVLGRKIELVLEDTKMDAASSVAAMRKLIDVDKVSIIETASTPVTLPMLPVAEERKILIVSTTTEYPALTKSPWAVRGTPIAGQDSALLARAAYKKGLKTSVVLSDQNESIAVSVQSYVDEYTKLGGKILGIQTFNGEDTDIRGQITKLSAVGGDSALLVLSSSGRATALAFRQLSEAGFRPKQIFSNPNAVDSAIAASGSTDATEGTIFASALVNPAFAARFAKAQGYEISAIGARVYDGATLLYDAIQKAGSPDSTRVRDTLYNYGTFNGVTGKYVYHGTGQPDCLPALFVIKNGKPIPYTL